MRHNQRLFWLFLFNLTILDELVILYKPINFLHQNQDFGPILIDFKEQNLEKVDISCSIQELDIWKSFGTTILRNYPSIVLNGRKKERKGLK